jgi:probable phosphoglycerate mutase
MKTVYLVRHGESEGNAGPFFQGLDSPLTEKGKQQALEIAGRCSGLPVDLLVASPAKRTEETAQAIADKINKPIEWSELFVERRRPSEIIGKRKDDPDAKLVEDKWFESIVGSDGHVGDGENFQEITARARQALLFLEQKTEQHIVVVTHGFFLRVMLGEILFGDSFTPEDLQRVIAGFRTENTGITVLSDDSWLPEIKWRIRTFNDHAHLG